MNIREKVYMTGQYMEIDILQIRYISKKRKKYRRRKSKVSSPRQKSFNDKWSKRYFTMLVNSNFNKNDYHESLTYDDEHYPETAERAEKDIRNFLDRVKRRQKKLSNEKIKYVVVESGAAGNEEGRGRKHFHLIIKTDVPRDELESLWGKGRANADRLQPDEEGFGALSDYLQRQGKSKRKWSSSHNLTKPILIEQELSGDSKATFSQKRIDELRKLPEDGSFWEKRYKGYIFTRMAPVWKEETGEWSLYIKMRKTNYRRHGKWNTKTT
jgi:hypothetical protein